ncbi:MAG: hypothetical protein LBQ58_10650 [Synergistaceae bacterium]|jgi:hypothetical protein|nr:hypothetical protein [Synergistaceae bacterium]
MISIANFATAVNMPESTLTGIGRAQGVTDARHAIWYVMRASGLSYNRIAQVFNRKHCTVLSGVRRFTQLLKFKDREAVRLYDLINHIDINNMSVKQQILVINPPQYRQKTCSFQYTDFNCPACSGRGYFTPVEVKKDVFKKEKCDFCGGSGRLEAHVTVEWMPENLKSKKNGKRVNSSGRKGNSPSGFGSIE